MPHPQTTALLHLDDQRVDDAFHGRSHRNLALVEDYAREATTSVERVLASLTGPAAAAQIQLEFVEGRVAVHTAPRGRHIPGQTLAPANLWETLRRRATPETAMAWLNLARSAQDAGWTVEADPATLEFHTGQLDSPATLGLYLGTAVTPLLAYPTAALLGSSTGPLSAYHAAGAAGVAVAVRRGALDAATTAARRWVVSRGAPPEMWIALLEAPSFSQPAFVTAHEGSISPESLHRIVTETKKKTPPQPVGAHA